MFREAAQSFAVCLLTTSASNSALHELHFSRCLEALLGECALLRCRSRPQSRSSLSARDIELVRYYSTRSTSSLRSSSPRPSISEGRIDIAEQLLQIDQHTSTSSSRLAVARRDQRFYEKKSRSAQIAGESKRSSKSSLQNPLWPETPSSSNTEVTSRRVESSHSARCLPLKSP